MQARDAARKQTDGALILPTAPDPPSPSSPLSPFNIWPLQNAALSLVQQADITKDERVLRMNPHLWRSDDMYTVYRDPTLRNQKLWNCDWPKLRSFVNRHGLIQTEDFQLAYHGARNSNRASHILFEGLDPKFRRQGPGHRDHAFFGVSTEACKAYGDIVLFVIPKSACSGVRGDGAFTAHEFDALPIGLYQYPSNWSFSDLFNGCKDLRP